MGAGYILQGSFQSFFVWVWNVDTRSDAINMVAVVKTNIIQKACFHLFLQ